MSDVGVTTVTTQSAYSFTSILLSAVPIFQQSGAHLVSVLVISVPRSSTLHLNVSCTNNVLIKFRNVTTPKCTGKKDDITTSDNRTIVLQHILSAPLLVNSSVLVHIFMCGTDSLLQLIGKGNKAVGFGEKDNVGATGRDLLPDNKMVNIQAVLISRQPLETTTLVFILSDTSFNASCSFKFNRVQLQPQKCPGFNFTNSMPVDGSLNDSRNTQYESHTTAYTSEGNKFITTGE